MRSRDGNQTKASALVIGAGPAGLCLSLALAAQGLEVDLVERQHAEALADPAFDGREIALTHASMRLLRMLGVWRHIPERVVAPLRRARIMDGATAAFEVDGAEFGHEQLGALVPNQAIRAAAWQAAASQERIRIHSGISVEAVACRPASASATLADGRVLEAPLLVAADSRFSEIRRSMGIPVHMHDFGKSMLVCRMRHSGHNDGTAWEWFGRGQTRALLPLQEHLSSVVLTVPDIEARQLLRLSPEAFAAEISSRYEHRLAQMTLESTIHRYPLVATWARRFIAHRFALAGDAAVGMHPVTAHGFNLGLASVEHLAQAVGDGLRRHGDPAHPALLARYQLRHRAASAWLFAGTGMLVDLFTSERALVQPLRRAVIGAGRRLPPLRRALAAGLLDESVRPISLSRHMRMALDVLRPRRAPVAAREA